MRKHSKALWNLEQKWITCLWGLFIFLLRRFPMSTTPTHTDRKRKIRALLAGGVVLGVGAAVTLAAWTDQEWATGDFAAGSFGIEGSTDGSAFADHETADGAATLDFQIGADNLTPGDTVAAPFVLRTVQGTSYDAAVELTSAAGTGDNAPHLTYGITQVGAVGDCVAGATGTEIMAPGTALDTAAGAAGFTLDAATADAAGAPVVLCLQVTAGDTLEQAGTATASWEFTATSVE